MLFTLYTNNKLNNSTYALVVSNALLEYKKIYWLGQYVILFMCCVKKLK